MNLYESKLILLQWTNAQAAYFPCKCDFDQSRTHSNRIGNIRWWLLTVPSLCSASFTLMMPIKDAEAPLPPFSFLHLLLFLPRFFISCIAPSSPFLSPSVIGSPRHLYIPLSSIFRRSHVLSARKEKTWHVKDLGIGSVSWEQCSVRWNLYSNKIKMTS